MQVAVSPQCSTGISRLFMPSCARLCVLPCPASGAPAWSRWGRLITLVGDFLTPHSAGDDTMTGDGGEYLRPEDLKELGDDSLPGSQFLDGMNYLRYSLEGGRSDR